MNIEDAVVARYSKGGEHFEVLIDPKGAEDFKEGNIKKSRLSEFMPVDSIFKNVSKGDKASEEALKKHFGTDDPVEVAAYIIEHGEIQLTTEQRREMLERKTQKLISYIASQAVDPRNNKPHPPDRIKNALEEAKFRVDLHKSMEKQVDEALKILRPILPIKFEIMKIAVKIPANYAAKAHSQLNEYKITKEEWQQDGSLVAIIELPGGMQDQLYSALNSFTHGEVETRILK